MGASDGSERTPKKETGSKPTRGRRRKTAEPASRGLSATQVAQGSPPAAVRALAEAIAGDGGAVLATYRDPLGGHWQILAAIPIAKIQPTPFQRDLSDPHVERLASAIGGLDRFLDPVIAVRNPRRRATGRRTATTAPKRCAVSARAA